MIDIEKYIDSGELFDKYYMLLRPINTEGGTADVWLALDIRTVKDKGILKDAAVQEEAYLATKGLLVAIKVYRPKNALDIEGETKFLDEFAIVYNCRHSNLITPTSFSIFEETPYLVLPYCKMGSSELLIGNMTSNDVLWKYISDVSSGLAYLHRCNPPIIHQDIKPANVLIDDFNNYAITDFGISEKCDYHNDDDDYDERSGTSAYMSPERFDSAFEPSKESDIWAFGATIYELITGNVPFGEDGGRAQTNENFLLDFPEGISSDIQKLIYDCLSVNPMDRPKAEQIVEYAQIALNGRNPFHEPKPWYVKYRLPLIICISAVVLILTIVITKQITDKEVADEPFELTGVAKAVDLMKDPKTAKDGFNYLGELANKRDAEALYLLSRLYFGKKNNEYDPDSTRNMRQVLLDGKVINSDYNKAHDMLLIVIEINPYDYHALYELGRDCLAGNNREHERELETEDFKKANEYFTRALECAKKKNDIDYIERIREQLDMIKTVI